MSEKNYLVCDLVGCLNRKDTSSQGGHDFCKLTLYGKYYDFCSDECLTKFVVNGIPELHSMEV